MINNRKGVVLMLTVGVALASILSACSERENPLRQRDQIFQPTEQQTIGFDVLKNNDMADPDSRQIIIAYASDKSPSTPQQRFPVLYLLHDLGGDAQYFNRYNLQSLLTDMYLSGEIGRMMVVMLDGSTALGGGYFRDAGGLGNYESFLADAIAHTERTFRVYTPAGAAARAISGHGMGGYGALRFALDRPDMFGSVSAMSAPLSFGGPDDDFGVWAKLWEEVKEENGITVPVPDNGIFDLMPSHSVSPVTYPATHLFLAMSASFSPHPLRQFDSTGTLIVCGRFCNCVCKDTFLDNDFFSPLVAGTRTLRIGDIGDSTGIGIDLFVDSSGIIDESIWSLWSDSADVKNVFARMRNADPTFFDNVALYFDVGEDDELGYREQNEDFDSYLRSVGYEDYTFEVYPGVAGLPAGHSQLIHDRLRRIIKFHDAQFEANGGRPPSPD